MTARLRAPTAADADLVRSEAAIMGYSVRVRRFRHTLRICGDRSQVRDILVCLGFVTACGESFADPQVARHAWNQPHEVFAYIPA